MKKVSVVVPAYCPGDGINRVVRSLDAQTMSTDDFELIIIDDGSPDGTWKRLEEIRDERSYVRIDRIPNSGWPSRPRNVGTDLAEGEYVLYMDHDDELFPDGLQVAYDFASRNRADVLNAKESKTSDISWGISNYSADIPNAKPSRGIDALLPMMPHKFYRTAFLRDHNIRFPEGHRMLWEDIYFNVAAFRHADVISILSSTPVYLWVQTKSNSSATYRPRDEEFWQKLTALLTYIHQTLPGDEFAAARDATLAHQLNTRVIGRFYTEYGKSKDRRWLPMAQGYLTNILENLMPARLDERLPVVVKPRAFLIRHGRFDLLDALRKSEGSWVGKSQADDIHWDSSGQLVVTSTARWTNAKGQPLTLLRSGDTLLRSLPAELMQVLPAQLVDVTKAVQNGRTMVTVRDRQARVTWTAPSDRQTSLVPVAGAAAAGSGGDAEAVTVAISSTATIDVGRNRGASTWDIHARNSLLGYTNHRAMHTESLPRPAVVDGRLVQCETDELAKLSIAISAKAAGLTRLVTPIADRVRFEPATGGTRMTIGLSGADLYGEPVEGSLVLTPVQPLLKRIGLSTKLSKLRFARGVQRRLVSAIPATVEATDGGIEVTAVVQALPGVYSLALSTGGTKVRWPVTLHVGPTGAMRVEPAA